MNLRRHNLSSVVFGMLFALCAFPAFAKDGVQGLTLLYTGDQTDAQVTVEQTTQGKTKTVIFDEVVQPGDELELEGADRNGTLGPVLRIRVDKKMNASIRTNCSASLEPGLAFGDFEIVEVAQDCADGGEDSDSGEEDPPDDGEVPDGGEDPEDPDDGEDPDCGECEGHVEELTLLYHGEGEALVRVTQKIKRNEVTIFEDLVAPEQPFTVEGANGRGTLGSKILIYVNDRLHGRIHTSCSEPIGPGLVVGDFEVVEGYSRKGGRLCPLADDDGDGEDDETGCEECEGQVADLTLRYLGTETAHVEVTQKIRSVHVTIFDDLVDPDGAFTIYGANPRGTLGSKVRIFVEGERAGKIDTSCEEAIGPGLVVGDFEVVDGSSRKGGRLCPLPADDPE